MQQGMKRMNDINNTQDFDGAKKMRGDAVTLRFLMMSKHAGGIIGKGGVTIKRLRSEFNASVNVPDSQTPERVLSIQASQKEAIDVLLECLPLYHEPPYTGQSGQNPNPAEFEINFLIHTSQVGGIIGKGGSKIKELRESTNAHLKVFQETLGHSTERVVSIAGGRDEIEACVREILAIMQDSPIKGAINLYDPASPGFEGMYGGGNFGGNMRGGGRGGGRGGRGGGAIRGNFGGANQGGFGGGYGGRGGGNMGGAMGGGMDGMGGMPGMGMGGWNAGGAGATPGGPPQDVMAGTGFTYGQNNEYNGGNQGGQDFETQTTQVTIPKDVAGAIIGRGGDRIRNIRAKSGAVIKIEEAKEDSKDRLITLTGNNNQIQYAQFLMQQSVRQYSQTAQGQAAGAGGAPGGAAPAGGAGF